ncbi:MAG: hypothetical protein JOZ83_17210 [Silvibacterium sp.]|nr:hypothetical protein [Silvibacterium sp.]
MRLLKILVGVTVFAFAAIAVLLGLLWLDHFRSTQLLTPTGPFAVGRTQYVWADSVRSNLPSEASGEQRTLLAWIWYPAAAGSAGNTVEYLPAPWRTALANAIGIVPAQLFNRDLSRVRTHSLGDPDLSPTRKTYPLILMRGGHSALTTDYTTVAEDLASHGYIVAGIDAPYRTMVVVLPDGRAIARSPENNAELGDDAQQMRTATHLVEAWSADMSYAVDQLERLNASDPSGKFRGRLDLDHIGAFGHSLGGAESLQFCHEDSRCKAAIDVDGTPFGSVVATGVSQPFMFLLSDHSGEPSAESAPIEAKLHSIFGRLPKDSRLQVTIRGATHFGFADDVKNHIVTGILLKITSRMAARRQLQISSQFINAFFDVHLRGEPPSRLEDQCGNPQVQCSR